MTQKEISDYRDNITRLLADQQLAEAIDQVRNLAQATGANWDLMQELDRQEATYSAMLQYLTAGGADPERDDVLTSIRASIFAMVDQLTRSQLAKEAHTLYYDRVRVALARPVSIPRLLQQYSPFGPYMAGDAMDVDQRQRAQRLESDIFTAIWTSFPLSDTDYQALSDFLADDNQNWMVRAQMISALTLALFEYYDTRKMRLLIQAYQADEARLSLRALVGLLLALYRYRNRPADRHVEQALMAMKEVSKTWQRDVRAAYLALIRARDTERVTQKMRNEVFPGLQNLSKDLMNDIEQKKKIDPDAEVEGFDLMDINPDWEEKLRQSGLHDRLMEINELQSEGSDVMMSTFANMKSFPFFNEIENWFAPFNAHRTELAGANNLDTLASLPIMCDSDQYSLALMLAQQGTGGANDAFKSMMQASRGSEMKSQFFETMGIKPDDPTDPEWRKLLLNNYLHDLYRFFKVFRRKGEFRDPFRHAIDLGAVAILGDELNNIDTQQLVAELYFHFEDYQQALNAYLRLYDLGELSEELEQKIGWCYQQQGDYAQALTHYQQAELFNANSRWTLKRMAVCARQLGDHAGALQYLDRFEALKPDTVANAMARANELLALDKYADAIKLYYKVEFLKPDSKKYQRPLAWALLNAGQRDRARQYYQAILDEAPMANDYLNAGHLELLDGNISQAINLYHQAVGATAGDQPYKQWRQALMADSDTLTRLGLDNRLTPLALVADAVKNSFK